MSTLSRQRIGWAQTRNWLDTYSKGFIGCASRSLLLPHDVRREAVRDLDDTVSALGSRAAYAGPSVPTKGALVLPAVHYLDQCSTAFRTRQLTGDCVSHAIRNAIDVTRAYEVALGEAEVLKAKGATAGYYAERGHTGAGASTARIARAAVRIGILLEEILRGPDGKQIDFRNYERYYVFGMRQGRTGLPGWVTDITSRHAPEVLCLITDKDELMSALANGYGVCCGSMLGVSRSGGYKGVPWLSARSGSWAHAMTIIGYDDRRLDTQHTMFLWGNSWGQWNDRMPWPAEYGKMPPGAFALTADDTMWAVRSGECFAFASVRGFRPEFLTRL